MGTDPRPRLDQARLRRRLSDQSFVPRLDLLDSVDSTNDAVRRLAASGAPSGSTVVARHQSAARGRQGRRWHSSPDLGLYVSILLRPSRPVSELTRWTLAAAVAVCDACRVLTRAPVEIKWPNDLVCRGRKLCGILAESRSGAGSIQELIIGTGLNVFHAPEDFDPEIRATATSLQLCMEQGIVDPESLLIRYLEFLGQNAGRLESGEWAAVARRFEQLAPGVRGSAVCVVPPHGEPFRGRTAGLAGDGALCVAGGDGGMLTVHLADSVRYAEI